jgi:ribosome-associated protein
VLDLRDVSSFADFFVLATGSNARQNQTISDEVESQLKKSGERPHNVEGYTHADWILMDYGDTLVHIFSEKARGDYDLERLWRDAKAVEWDTLEVAKR